MTTEKRIPKTKKKDKKKREELMMKKGLEEKIFLSTQDRLRWTLFEVESKKKPEKKVSS